MDAIWAATCGTGVLPHDWGRVVGGARCNASPLGSPHSPSPCFLETGVLLFGSFDCRAQAILALLRDEGRLAAEREAHARKRGTYQGFSSVDMAQASMA